MLEMLEAGADDVDGVLWFQQDSATARTARGSMDCVTAMFLGRVILRSGDRLASQVS
jgi:hypothetical protein